uniref:Curlin associated repeat protein n=1 Tax=Shewanella sp. (strain MR-7) TaxID=60481 RepID=Q0HRH3_SHESR
MSTLPYRICAWLGFAFYCFVGMGQVNAQELSLNLQALLERSGRDNLITFIQQGNINIGGVLQAGNDNSAYLIQQGNNNNAIVIQVGIENEVQLQQAGNSNSALITQWGDANLVQLNQTGSNNFSITQIADNAAISITQY